jgi:hypothetical protein
VRGRSIIWLALLMLHCARDAPVTLVIAAAEVRKYEMSLHNMRKGRNYFLISPSVLPAKNNILLVAPRLRRELFMSTHRSDRFSLVPFSVYAAVATAFVFIVLILAGVLPRIP